MAKIQQMAFAAIDMRQKPKPHILSWTVNGSAAAVRQAIGKAWYQEDPKEGWKAARTEGIKVVKIAMTVPNGTRETPNGK